MPTLCRNRRILNSSTTLTFSITISNEHDLLLFETQHPLTLAARSMESGSIAALGALRARCVRCASRCAVCLR